MPAGLTIVNDANTVQIDENYKNLAVATKVPFTTTIVSGGAFWGNYQHADIVYTARYAEPPMVAVEATEGSFVFLLSATGNTFTFRMVFPLAGSTVTGTFWIFDQPPSSSTSTFGLQVCDAQGRLTFDALFRYARVVGRMSVPFQNWGDPDQQYPVPAGRKYIAVQSVCGTYAQSNPISIPGQPPSFDRLIAIRLVLNQPGALQTARHLMTYNMSFAMPSMRRTAEYTILDMTGA
ncbi:hypothetical protein [Stenotrophomonas sp. 278]|uniref:hypothetical protein n=1 Tax=Stenotrophomonas sp. 278 TaxID=2479851 RepID=UPI000F6804B3|nr:hypothetical protein [Stenotrophomonas sp. 278]RRU23566.1 hypothetical protein EGJ34_02675 [Stenotrophomonas sp. 278]